MASLLRTRSGATFAVLRRGVAAPLSCVSGTTATVLSRKWVVHGAGGSSSSTSIPPSAALQRVKAHLYRPACFSHSMQIRRLTHDILANGDIPFPRVRVVDDSGLVGDFNLGEARSLARQRKTDLVVLSGAVQPPLCRLVPLDRYIAELDEKDAKQDELRRNRLNREFSFDPALKVKGMRFTAMIDEHDLERKVNQIRRFLEKGHRVEARIAQGRSTAEDVLDLGLRICAEIRDLAKPENLEESVREFRDAVHAPKSLKARGRDPKSLEQLRLRLWPCTAEQASVFTIPAHILGPRRRRGPAIVGIDDGDEAEDAWKLNRKPRSRLPSNARRETMMRESHE